MVLAVDIGNSNIVLGCFEGERVVFEERLSTNRNATELEYTVTIAPCSISTVSRPRPLRAASSRPSFRA